MEKQTGLTKYIQSSIDNDKYGKYFKQVSENKRVNDLYNKIVKLMNRRDKVFYKYHPAQLHQMKYDLATDNRGIKRDEYIYTNDELREVNQLLLHNMTDRAVMHVEYKGATVLVEWELKIK